MCREPARDLVFIEVDPTAEPITGVVRHGSAPERTFSGWLELVALLESERGSAATTTPPPEPV